MSAESDRGNRQYGGSASLPDAIQLLHNISQEPSKQRRADVSAVVGEIVSAAHQSGIPPDELAILVDILALPNNLDQGSVTTMVKNLYPSTKISSTIVRRVICSLGPGKTKPSPTTQALLLHWLLLVHDMLQNPLCLPSHYTILFSHIDMLSLRRPLCQLLSTITRRRHVKPYRVQVVIELLQNARGDIALEELAKTYKNYCPDIIVPQTRLRSLSHLASSDREWRERARDIQSVNMAHDMQRTRLADRDSSFRVVRRGAKRTRIAIIPEVRTTTMKRGHTTLEEIEDVEGFVDQIESIELPNQVASMVQDTLAMKLLNLRSDPLAGRRLDEWLESFLLDFDTQSDNGTGEEKKVGDESVFGQLLNYVRFKKSLPRPLEDFLLRQLMLDKEKNAFTFELLSYLEIRPFEDLHKNIFAALESMTIHNAVESRVIVLEFYTTLLGNWTNVILSNGQWTAEQVETTSRAVSDLVNHASMLSLFLLETSQNASEDAVLTFYSRLAKLYSYAPTFHCIRIRTPPMQVVYLLSFTNRSSSVSLLCGLLTTYKQAYEGSMAAAKDPNAGIKQYPLDEVNRFNGEVMDMCNMLWRNRGLNRQDPNALGCLVPPKIQGPAQSYLNSLLGEYSLPALFSISSHGALSAMSADCFRELEAGEAEQRGGALMRKLGGPASQKNLTELEKSGGLEISWPEYRVKFLKWIEDRGSDGVGRLMRNTMKVLRQTAP